MAKAVVVNKCASLGSVSATNFFANALYELGDEDSSFLSDMAKILRQQEVLTDKAAKSILDGVRQDVAEGERQKIGFSCCPPDSVERLLAAVITGDIRELPMDLMQKALDALTLFKPRRQTWDELRARLRELNAA